FLVLATQNPIEYEGTYPLPEAQLDRFLIRTSIGYPAAEDEWQVLARRMSRATDDIELSTVVSAADFVAMQQAVENIYVDPVIGRYMVEIVTATRKAPQVQLGASPRGSLALLKLSRVHAALRGRDFVVPDDVKAVAVVGLCHRLVLRPEFWIQRVRTEDVVAHVLSQVATPVAAEPDIAEGEGEAEGEPEAAASPPA